MACGKKVSIAWASVLAVVMPLLIVGIVATQLSVPLLEWTAAAIVVGMVISVLLLVYAVPVVGRDA